MVIALVLAILYFMLMTLVMIDSSRAQAEAQRFRARMVAAILAEDAAELSCKECLSLDPRTFTSELKNEMGTASGSWTRTPTSGNGTIEIHGDAEASGVIHQKASVRLIGTVTGNGDPITSYTMRISWPTHSQ